VTPPLATAPAVRAPERAAGVEMLGALVGSGYRRAPGLVRRRDGQTVQLTPLLYALLELVDARRQPAELAEELGRRVALRVTTADVERLLDKLRPLGLLRTVDGSVQTLHKADPLLALKLKVVVTDPAVTRRITAPFAALFSPLVVWPVLVLFAVTCWWVLLERGLASAASSAIYSPGLLLAVFALTVVSAGFHEFGHAAACRYGGATPGAMGAGLYLLWPAFYTDVDDSYRLSRWGRLRVDLGGLYFNAIVAVVFAALASATGVEALLLVVATQLMQMVRQLAPFLRADGYHLLADLTGVPDLFAHIGPTLRGLLPGGWGQPSPLQRWARVVVTAWVLVMVPLLLGLLVFLVYLLPRLAATAWDSIGVQGGLLAGEVADGDAVMIAARLLALVSVCLPVAAISYLLVRVVRRTVARVLRATQDRPQARLVAFLGAAFLAAVVAGAWWPSGQYTPVEARGAGSPPAAAPVAGPADASPVALAEQDEPVDPPTTTTTTRTSTRSTATAVAPEVRPQPRVAPVAPAQAPPPAVAARTRPWPFPFPPPAPPRPHDNQALAVGLTDGAVVYDVATSWEWVTDGRPVDHRNEAYALASCEGCSTVAVAFQVVLVVGQSHLYAPVNLAGGLNYECTQCHTRAVAVQLVLTLTGVPDAQVMARLQAAWAQVQGLEGRVRGMTVEQTYALLEQVEAQFVAELEAAGVLSGVHSDDASTEPEVAATTTEAPVEEPVDEPVEEMEQEAAREPVLTPVDATPDATSQATSDATVQPTEDPVEQPVEQPVEEPTEEPTQEPTEDAATREEPVAPEEDTAQTPAP
jgi:putative peptide zinc metalloprotease protein